MALNFNMYPEQTSSGYYNQGESTDPNAWMKESASDLGEIFGTSLAQGRQKIREIGGLGPLGKAWRKYKNSAIDPVTEKAWVNKVPMGWKQFKKSSYGQAHKEKIKYDRTQRREAAAANRDAWGEKAADDVRGFYDKAIGKPISNISSKIAGILPNLSGGFPTPNLEGIQNLNIAPHGGILGKIFTPDKHAIRKHAASGQFVTPNQRNVNLQTQILPQAGMISGSKEKQFADWYDYAQGLWSMNLPKGFSDDERKFMEEYGGWANASTNYTPGPDKIGSVVESQGYRDQ